MAISVLATHIVFEGVRWHLAPAYLVTIALVIVLAGTNLPTATRWPLILGFICLASSAVVGSVLPVFAMPRPTGPHQVGTVTLHLIDNSRHETLGETPTGYRELMVQVWYPSDVRGPGRPYRSFNEVAFPKDHLALVLTHASEGVPMSKSQLRFPIVLFSPSWIGRRNQNTVQAVELASHGFVVVGIDHPFCTDLTIFPDGRQARTILGEPLDFASDETFVLKSQLAENQVRIRAADVRFVLDQFELINQDDPMKHFTGRLDIERTAVFGHSFGGAVAAEVCSQDPRVKLGANLDGFVYGSSLATGFRKPFLVIETDMPCPTAEQIALAKGSNRRHLSFIAENTHAIRAGMSMAGGYWISIRGTTHMNFCDSPLYTPIKSLSHAGPIAPSRAWEIINAALLKFFLNLGEINDNAGSELRRRFPEINIEKLGGTQP
jgi:predicted dienelactone hydrolase